MSGLLLWCFVVSVAAAMYPVLGYPLVLSVIAALRPRPVRRGAYVPTVTVLIPAYNEAACIAATIQNKLEQDYPSGKLQIIVASDASEDATDRIVEQFADKGVVLLRRPQRHGKAAALNEAVRRANGEIIVFSDANSTFAFDTVRRLAENFADDRVGYVTGSLRYLTGRETTGQGGNAYLAYENWLRRIETQVDSVVGVNGGVDAMRRDLYADVPPDQITDFVLPLQVMAAGYRVVYDERAVSSEVANDELGQEFRMRVRVALRALRGLDYVRESFSVFRAPLLVFCIVSHKILRYFGFAFMAGALVLNCVLAVHSQTLAYLLLSQLAFYSLAFLGLSRHLPRSLRRVTALPTYFLMSNVAFAVAAVRFVRGDVVATWRPRAG